MRTYPCKPKRGKKLHKILHFFGRDVTLILSFGLNIEGLKRKIRIFQPVHLLRYYSPSTFFTILAMIKYKLKYGADCKFALTSNVNG